MGQSLRWLVLVRHRNARPAGDETCGIVCRRSTERLAYPWCERARVLVEPGASKAPPIAPGAVRFGSALVRLAADGSAKTEIRTFDTTTPGLLALSAWLADCGCTHVAMEASGIYWKPVWHILSDGDLTLILANAAHVKNVPGRKTDVGR